MNKSSDPCRCSGSFFVARYPQGSHLVAEHEALLREQMIYTTNPHAWSAQDIDREARINFPKASPSYFDIDRNSMLFSGCPTCGVEEMQECLDLRSKKGKCNLWVHDARFDGCLRYHSLTPEQVTGEESRRIRAIRRWQQSGASAMTSKERRAAREQAEQDAYDYFARPPITPQES